MIQKTNPKNWEILHDYYKNNLYYSDISEKDEYMKKHGIKFDTLPNGIRLLGAVSISSDKKSAYTVLSFERGALLDPDGKEGLHHLYEHLAKSDEFYEFVGTHNQNRNAFTGLTKLCTLQMSGIWNCKFPEYGHFACFKEYINKELFSTKHITEELIISEKSVVRGEIKESNLSTQRCVAKEMNKIIYGEDSNRNLVVLGDEDTVESITKDDLISLVEKGLGTTNMTVELHVMGSEDDFDILYEKYLDLLSQIPRKDTDDLHKLLLLDHSNYRKLNPTYTVEVPSFKPGLTDISINYLLTINLHTTKSFAFNIISGFIKKVFGLKFRLHGLQSYSQYVDLSSFDHKTKFLSLGCIVRHEDVEMAQKILKQTLFEIFDNKAYLEKALNLQALDEIATPNYTLEILDNFVDDLLTFRDIFQDWDKSSEARVNLDTNIFYEIIEEIKAKDPISLIVRQKD